MTKPAIIVVDDDPGVLNAVERDLRRKYGQGYRIIKMDSGERALETLHQLRLRDDPVALFVADQRMPKMTGVEFLEQASTLYIDSKKVLLTAYADSQAAIDSINRLGLDYYLMKPWDPPEEHLYPVLDDLLEDWTAHFRPPFQGFRLAGTHWSPSTHQIKDFFTRHQIAYHWVDLERDAQTAALLNGKGPQTGSLPAVIFPDGAVLFQPSLRELAEKMGLATLAKLPFYDLVIAGAGPAGISAAVFASSEGLRCLVIEKSAPGGQAGSSPRIENYFGFPNGISGNDLTRRGLTQARRLGAEILTAQEAKQIQIEDPYRVVTLADGSQVSCHAVLIATGASFNTLKAAGASQLGGRGIYYGAAYTEAHYYQDQEVFVVGGANSAAQGALFLSRFASRVTILIRGAEPTAAQHLKDEINRNEKIRILPDRDLVEVHGEDKLEAITVKDNHSGELEQLEGAALFVFIGVRPQSQWVDDLVERNEKGYILTGPDLLRGGRRPRGWTLDRDPMLLETNLPGIYAAGDVRYGTNHRVSSAAAEGGIAVALIRQYLNTL
jgi:thioredoxin reductase (NADPH)